MKESSGKETKGEINTGKKEDVTLPEPTSQTGMTGGASDMSGGVTSTGPVEAEDDKPFIVMKMMSGGNEVVHSKYKTKSEAEFAVKRLKDVWEKSGTNAEAWVVEPSKVKKETFSSCDGTVYDSKQESVTEAEDGLLKPPSKWYAKMYKQIHKQNDTYSDEQLRNTIGDIWYHQLTPAKRKEIREEKERHTDPPNHKTIFSTTCFSMALGSGKRKWLPRRHGVRK